MATIRNGSRAGSPVAVALFTLYMAALLTWHFVAQGDEPPMPTKLIREAPAELASAVAHCFPEWPGECVPFLTDEARLLAVERCHYQHGEVRIAPWVVECFDPDTLETKWGYVAADQGRAEERHPKEAR